jgi:hypothetical protein
MDGKSEWILMGLLILLLIPTLNYNFKIIFIIIIVYLIFFPDKRTKLYENLGFDKRIDNKKDPEQIYNKLEKITRYDGESGYSRPAE